MKNSRKAEESGDSRPLKKIKTENKSILADESGDGEIKMELDKEADQPAQQQQQKVSMDPPQSTGGRGIKIVATKITRNPDNKYPGCVEAIRQAREKKNHHEPDPLVEVLISSLPQSVLEKYGTTLKEWWDFCRIKNCDPLETKLLTVIEFLKQKLNTGASNDDLKSIGSAMCLIASTDLSQDIYLTSFLSAAAANQGLIKKSCESQELLSSSAAGQSQCSKKLDTEFQKDTNDVILLESPSPASKIIDLTGSDHEMPRYVDGKFAICNNCSFSSMDFNRCYRCKHKLPSDIKMISGECPEEERKKMVTLIENYYKETFCNNTNADALTRPLRRPRREKKKTKLTEKPVVVDSSSSTSALLSPVDTIINNTNNDLTQIDDGMTMKQPQTSLLCRAVRIGSYNYIPKDDIIINSSGLTLSVPLLEDDTTYAKIHIKFQNIIKVLIHFANSMPVLFFYTNTITGSEVRDVLGMQNTKEPYYDPDSEDKTHKTIILLPRRMIEDSKFILKQLFLPNKLLEEIHVSEANSMLIKASPTVSINTSRPRRIGNNNINNQSVTNAVVENMTVQPPGRKSSKRKKKKTKK